MSERRGRAPHQLIEMARHAESQLDAELALVNALNVFPVPDGDTGSNMLATVREALHAVEASSDSGNAAADLARGALLGARGNSGVILSQLFRAQKEILATRVVAQLRPKDLSAIMIRASDLAREIVSNPVEGTMLSVLSALAEVPVEQNLDRMLQHLLKTAEEAVARTPDQLPILREAQVVDSGGYGLLLVMRGWYEALAHKPAPAIKGELLGLARAREQVAAGTAHPADLVNVPDAGYGYCITLLVNAPSADEAVVRQRLAGFGDSVLVAVAGDALKLHVHAPDPEAVQTYGRQLGTLTSAEISNIDEQTSTVPPIPVVAVAPGNGLAQVFRGFGAAVLPGGPAQNPSTAELLFACDPWPAPVFVLPNDGNILNTARQAAAVNAGLTVVPTRTIPQGVAATLAYDGAATREENLARMTAAAGRVRSAELVRAARDATIGQIAVKSGQLMVLLEGDLLGVDGDGIELLARRAAEFDAELVTIYYGAATSKTTADELGEQLRTAVPELQIEVVRGEQPHSDFILGFE